VTVPPEPLYTMSIRNQRLLVLLILVMAQVQVELLKSEGISIIEVKESRVGCRLDLKREIIIKKGKDELKIYLREDSKTVFVSWCFIDKLLQCSESIRLIYAFIEEK